MENRYYITSIQIKTINDFAKLEDEYNIKKLLNKIEKKQKITNIKDK